MLGSYKSVFSTNQPISQSIYFLKEEFAGKLQAQNSCILLVHNIIHQEFSLYTNLLEICSFFLLLYNFFDQFARQKVKFMLTSLVSTSLLYQSAKKSFSVNQRVIHHSNSEV